MEYVFLFLAVAGIFGLCRLVDLGFQKVFRSAPQHASGMSVRLSKHFGGVGTVVLVLGICGVLAGIGKDWLLLAGGCLLMLTGGGLIIYYMTFGIYYDADSFVLSSLGKRSSTYRFEQIKGQQNFVSYGKLVIELHMEDGRAVQLQTGMTGLQAFMEKALEGWLRQKGIKKSDYQFCDPENSRWFPPVED